MTAPRRLQVGKTAYGRILRMGFPLPSAEVVSASMERAAAENVQWGLVEVLENRATGTAQNIQPVPTQTQVSAR